MGNYLRPIDLAKAVKLSPQTIRFYESLGFIPVPSRTDKGYRQYEMIHLYALKTARLMIFGYGWANALNIMKNVHLRKISEAVEEVNYRHGMLYDSLKEARQTLNLLEAVASGHLNAQDDPLVKNEKEFMQVKEVAELLNVRASAIRFWEQQGLIEPSRNKENRYRCFNHEQLKRLRIINLLRKAGYGMEAIRVIINEIQNVNLENALKAAHKRIEALEKQNLLCMRATSALWSYLEECGVSC